MEVLTSEADVLLPGTVSSVLAGIVLAYLGRLARISSSETSSVGCIILLVLPVVTMVFDLFSELLLLLLPLGLFVVGGALIVAPKINFSRKKFSNFLKDYIYLS